MKRRRQATRRRRRFVGEYLNPANLLTSGSLACGFLALILATEGELGWAAAAVGVAGGLTAVDGVAARRLAGDGGGFGASLNSLADLLSFGAAPALALYLSVLHEIPIVGISACVAFVVCGAWRLARFPLVKSPGRFLGLPLPPVGVAVVLLAALGPPPGLALAATFALTLLMVSDLPFPTWSPRRRSTPADQPLGETGAPHSSRVGEHRLHRSSRPTGGFPAAAPSHERVEP